MQDYPGGMASASSSFFPSSKKNEFTETKDALPKSSTCRSSVECTDSQPVEVLAEKEHSTSYRANTMELTASSQKSHRNNFANSPLTQLESDVNKRQSSSDNTFLENAVSTASRMNDWAGREVQRVLKMHFKSAADAGHVDTNGMFNENNQNDNTYMKYLILANFSIHNENIVNKFDDIDYNGCSNSKDIPEPDNILVPLERFSTSEKEVSTANNDIDNPPPIALPVTVLNRADLTLLLSEELKIANEDKEKNRSFQRDAAVLTSEMKEEVMELLDAFNLPYIVAPSEAEAQCAALERLKLVDGVVTEDSDTFLFGANVVYKNIFDDNKFVEVNIFD